MEASRTTNIPLPLPEFEVGQVVISIGGYNWLLTEGRRYTVTRYDPPVYTSTFTWPAYVTVMGDSGKPVVSHTHRFRALTEEEKLQLNAKTFDKHLES